MGRTSFSNVTVTGAGSVCFTDALVGAGGKGQNRSRIWSSAYSTRKTYARRDGKSCQTCERHSLPITHFSYASPGSSRTKREGSMSTSMPPRSRAMTGKTR